MKLISFEANKEGKSVQLSWATAEDENADHFYVEHSGNAKDWSAIGEVKAKGESIRITNHEFTDLLPSSETNYSRLRMVDNDESYMYSHIKSISLTTYSTISRFTLIPHPTFYF